MPVALAHFALSRGRKAQAQLAKTLELRVIQRMAVHDVDVLAQQAGGFELLPAVRGAGRPAALVQRSDQPQFLGHGEVVHRHVHG